MPWTIRLEPGWPDDGLPWRLALEVDPRRRTVALGPRMPGTGALEIQSGMIARSFYDLGPVELGPAGEWLAGDDALALLDTIAAGHAWEARCSGDLVASWPEDAWTAGAVLYEAVRLRRTGGGR